MLHPRFPEAIRKFANLPSAVCVISNGLLLHSYDPADLRNVSEFYISFDAPDRESYEKIRGVDGFERLVRSVAALNSLVPRSKMVARCTLQRANVGRLPVRRMAEGFIEGGSRKLERILQYFRALHGEGELPEVRCNAPWVSTVIETTGKVRGCFFHPVIGDFRTINGETAIRFRRSLNVSTDTTCRSCVCSKLLGAQDLLRM